MNTSAASKSARSSLRKGASRPRRAHSEHLSDPDPLKFPVTTCEPAKNRTPRGTVVFRFEASTANHVKLVADFTGWEKQPLDLRRTDDGEWQIAVELPRGSYSYRFLVDDEWHDDPRCIDYEPNPYGGLNAVVRVM